jgi:hypothetical protein
VASPRVPTVALLLALPPLLAGCLQPEQGSPDGLPADSEVCTPLVIVPATIRLPVAEPVNLAFQLTNCTNETVLIGGVDDPCDVTRGLRPTIERSGSGGAFRLGVPNRAEAVAPGVQPCPPYMAQPRPLKPGDVVVVSAPWNATFVENPCKQDVCPRTVPAEPGPHRVEVRLEDPEGRGRHAAWAVIEVLPPEEEPPVEPGSPLCGRVIVAASHDVLVVGDNLTVLVRLENCGTEPLTVGPGSYCNHANGLNATLVAGSERWNLRERGAAEPVKPPLCLKIYIPPRTIPPGGFAEAESSWNGTLVEDGRHVPAPEGVYTITAEIATREGRTFAPRGDDRAEVLLRHTSEPRTVVV